MTGTSGKKIKNSQFSNASSIILFDSSTSLEELKKLINHDVQIITFDYESHKSLLSENIDHEISDNFLGKEELESIQKKSYYYSKWFIQPEIKSFLEYENVNLGELYYAELHYFLVPFLKKLFEIINITKRFPKTKFIASSLLLSLIQNFSNNTLKMETNKQFSNKFLYDSIIVRIRLGNKTFSFSLSRNKYKKIKSIFDNTINRLFGLKKRFDKRKKSVLFVEFDTIRYKRLFSLTRKYPINVISYCRRRPSVWNLPSFNIIKNSNCIIESQFTLSDDKIKNIIGNKIWEKKMSDLWNNQIFFENFFAIDTHSFWNILKPFFTELTKKRIPEAILEIELAKKLLDRYDFSSIVVWSELGFNEKILIKLAKDKKIPVVLVQHGLGFETELAKEHVEFMAGIPIYVDEYFVWGQSFQNYLMKSNFNNEKVKIMGSMLHDELFNKKSKKDEDFILLITSSPVKNLINDLLVQTRIDYEEAIRHICTVVTKLNKKLIIKLHPDFEEIDISEIVKKINPQITVLKNANIFNLIESCELLITIDLSTTILEGQILEKPTMAISVKDYGFGIHEVFQSGSCLLTNLDNFESTFNKILTNQKFKNELIKKGQNYVRWYMSNPKNSSEKVLEFLLNL